MAADDRELEEFRAWKASKQKEELFGVLDEWAERSGLKALLEDVTGDDDDGGDDDGDDDLRKAAEKILAGRKAKAPKAKPKPKAKEGEGDPIPEPASLAARLGLTGS